jgi:DNA adenine methylase
MTKKLSILDVPKNPYPFASPLSYPGGKSVLSGLFADIIKSNKNIKTFVEPYAGGVGVGLSLLLNGVVENLVINDADIRVYCFWKALTEHTDELIKEIKTTEVTIEEWRAQKEIYASNFYSVFITGFAFLFLNRTNYSGILTGSPRGGYEQNGKYKIDARFNKAAVIDRIKKIAEFKDHITVTCKDGLNTFADFKDDEAAFIYLDPPYVKHANRLYREYFYEWNHKNLARTLNVNKSANWILSYDDDPLIRNLYKDRKQFLYKKQNPCSNKPSTYELLICSDSTEETIQAKAGGNDSHTKTNRRHAHKSRYVYRKWRSVFLCKCNQQNV